MNFQKCLILLLSLYSASYSHDTNSQILTIGDSLTAGFTRDGSGTTYCESLLRIIDRGAGELCYSDGFVNRGGYQPYLRNLTGENVTNWSRESLTASEIRSLYNGVGNRSQFKTITFLAGTNDVLRSSDMQGAFADIQSMALDASQYADNVFVLTLPPLSTSNSVVQDRLSQLNSLIRNSNLNVIDINTELDKNWNFYQSGDGIHLGSNGYQLIANMINAELQEPVVKISAYMPNIIMLLLEE